MAGCSSKNECEPCVKTIYPVLKSIDVNLSEVPTFRPDVTVLKGAERVSLTVDDLLTIQGLMNRLRKENGILREVTRFYTEQIIKFNKEFKNVE
jgi:hypothetical protein